MLWIEPEGPVEALPGARSHRALEFDSQDHPVQGSAPEPGPTVVRAADNRRDAPDRRGDRSEERSTGALGSEIRIHR